MISARREPWPSFSFPCDSVSRASCVLSASYCPLKMPSASNEKNEPGVIQPGLLVLASTPQYRRRNAPFRYDWSQASSRLLSSLQGPLALAQETQAF